MRRVTLAAAAALTALAASPAAARTVDYSRTDAQFAADAADLSISGIAAMPPQGSLDVVVEDLAKLDHSLLMLGISCRAWKIENPLSKMIQRTLAGWDRNGALEAVDGAPLLRVRFDPARSNMRCVQVRELKERCMVRTTIVGEAIVERPGQAPRSTRFAIDDQQVLDIGAFCAGLATGAGVSGRAASIALIGRLQEIAAAE